jgi:hypothetical protein
LSILHTNQPVNSFLAHLSVVGRQTADSVQHAPSQPCHDDPG